MAAKCPSRVLNRVMLTIVTQLSCTVYFMFEFSSFVCKTAQSQSGVRGSSLGKGVFMDVEYPPPNVFRLSCLLVLSQNESEFTVVFDVV